MTVVPIESGDPRGDALEHVLATVEHTHERVEIVRTDGTTVAVVLDPLELQGLEDTVELLSHPEASAALDEALAEADTTRDRSRTAVLQRLRERLHDDRLSRAGTNPS